MTLNFVVHQLVCCYPEEAVALTKSPFVRHITFIGSERVGRIVSVTSLLPERRVEVGSI